MKRLFNRRTKVRIFHEIDSRRRRAFSLLQLSRCQLQQSNGTRTTNNTFTAILLWLWRARARVSIKICLTQANFYQIARNVNDTIDLKLFLIGRDIR